MRTELPALDTLLDATADGDHPLAAGVRVLDERSARIASAAAELARLDASGRLTVPPKKLAASFVHMWLDRLARSDNRFHE